MKNLIFLLFASVLTISTVFGQNDRPALGLTFDDAAYNNTPHLPTFDGRKFNKLPLTVSLKDYCPTPGNQGFSGSCVGWACGYGALTASRAIKLELKDKEQINAIANSAFYLYNRIILNPKDCMSGAKITDAMNLLMMEGDCTMDTFDGECYELPTYNAIQEAMNYKIQDYAAVFAIEDDPKLKVLKTKKSLANNMPVMIGMNVTSSFWLLPNSSIKWESKEGEGVLGGHAMLVVGYDEVDKTFEIMNSWGTRWGNGGFVKVSYDDYAEYVKYGFQMLLDTKVEEEIVVNEVKTDNDIVKDTTTVITEIEEVNITGSFVFRYPDGYEKNVDGIRILDPVKQEPVIKFTEAKATYNSEAEVYELEKKMWSVGDMFQLVAKDVPTGKYVYVFSIDPKNKLEMHWPEMYGTTQEEVDAFKNVPISEYVPNESAEMIIPGAANALQLEEKGTDNLVVLYSDSKIENIDELAKVAQTSAGTIQERVNAGFGDMLIHPDYIKYNETSMGFESTSPSDKGSIVPIILTVNAN